MLLALGGVVSLMPGWIGPAHAYTVYGYEDPLGMLHLSKTKKDERYKPLYEGSIDKPPPRRGGKMTTGAEAPPASPKAADRPSHEELVRRLRENEAIVAPQGPLTGFTNLPPPPAAGPFEDASGWSPEQLARWAATRPYPHPQASKTLLAAIARHATANRLDPLLVYCVIEQESGFSASAVSPKGAEGIMQIMPDTQKLLGLASPFDADANIRAGATYLRWMLNAFKETALALAAYNAGPQNVEKYGGIPPFQETRDYVTRILARMAHLKDLPPLATPRKPEALGARAGRSGRS
ncbi:hypothetical protein JCM14635_21260 [Megalodesulfovibrio paquesii]